MCEIEIFRSLWMPPNAYVAQFCKKLSCYGSSCLILPRVLILFSCRMGYLFMR